MQQPIKDNKTKNIRKRRLNVVTLQMLREKTFPYQTNKITSPDSAANLLKEFIGNSDRENLVLLCLDTKNQITALHTVAIGSLNSAIVHPREIFKVAVLSNAASIILAHNHPSSDPTPSREDIEVTKRIKEASLIMGVELLDHVIVGPNSEYCSLREKGYV